MANFAKLNNDNIVIDVQSVHNNVATNEAAGITFLNNLYGTSDTWKQTFTDGTRKNNAGIGYTYDEDKDAFIAPKPFNSWSLNETTCRWEPPVVYPTDGQMYNWNEETTSWDLIDNS